MNFAVSTYFPAFYVQNKEVSHTLFLFTRESLATIFYSELAFRYQWNRSETTKDK